MPVTTLCSGKKTFGTSPIQARLTSWTSVSGMKKKSKSVTSSNPSTRPGRHVGEVNFKFKLQTTKVMLYGYLKVKL